MKKFLSLLVLVLMIFATIIISGGSKGFIYLIDLPSILLLEAITISMLVFSDLWKDYFNGLKILSNEFEGTTKEIKVSIIAFESAIRFMYYASVIIMIIGSVMIIRNIEDPTNYAPAFSVNCLVLFYAVLINLYHHGLIGKLKKELIYRHDD